MEFRDLIARWKTFVETPRGALLIRIVRYGVTLLVLGYLIQKLLAVGWQDVWDARPRTAWFYILGLLVYFSIPVTEMFIYRLIWKQPMARHFPAFMKKRIFNQDVIGYSGEVYFTSWAQKNLGLSLRRVAEAVRDNNIISSLASTSIALILIVTFLTIGRLGFDQLLTEESRNYILPFVGVLLILGVLFARFRKYLFSMPLKLAVIIFGVQCSRLLLGQALRIAQWSVALPAVSVEVWFSLAAASLVLSRIPFVPSQDLVFLGVGVEMSSMLGISEAAMFGMLAVSSAVDKLLNLFQFVLWSTLEQR